MESIYLWPQNPAVSLLLLWVLSTLFLWAAREPMLQVLRGVFRGLDGGLSGVAQWCREAAERQERRSRDALLAAGEIELRARLERGDAVECVATAQLEHEVEHRIFGPPIGVRCAWRRREIAGRGRTGSANRRMDRIGTKARLDAHQRLAHGRLSHQRIADALAQ